MAVVGGRGGGVVVGQGEVVHGGQRWACKDSVGFQTKKLFFFFHSTGGRKISLRHSS